MLLLHSLWDPGCRQPLILFSAFAICLAQLSALLIFSRAVRRLAEKFGYWLLDSRASFPKVQDLYSLMCLSGTSLFCVLFVWLVWSLNVHTLPNTRSIAPVHWPDLCLINTVFSHSGVGYIWLLILKTTKFLDCLRTSSLQNSFWRSARRYQQPFRPASAVSLDLSWFHWMHPR